jgi:hypothetical protein
MTNDEDEEATVLKSKVRYSCRKIKKETGSLAAILMVLTHIFHIVE